MSEVTPLLEKIGFDDRYRPTAIAPDEFRGIKLFGELNSEAGKEYPYAEKQIVSTWAGAQVRFGLEYWATPDMRKKARQLAMSQLAVELFGDAIMKLREARLAIMGGSKECALKSLDELEAFFRAPVVE